MILSETHYYLEKYFINSDILSEILNFEHLCYNIVNGLLAQLGERLVRNEEVIGSSPT